MGLILLTILFGLAALTLAICFGLLWLAARFVHPTLAAILGTGGVALTVFAIVEGFVSCNAPPVFVAPRPGDPGEGSMTFACDGPGGAAIYMSLFFVYPFIGLCLAIITYQVWLRAKKRQM